MAISPVTTFTRRPLDHVSDPASRLRTLTSSNTQSWGSDYPSPGPSVLFSALGTTRAQAGSFQKQREVDFDLNVAMARAAKNAGTKVYVLISSAGVSKTSMLPYSKLKAELDEAVSDLGFDKTVLVKPGLIVGQRADRRTAEAVLRTVAKLGGKISEPWLKDWWAQDAHVIARAAVKAGQLALEGKAPEGKVWILSQADIRRLGRDEWVTPS